MNNNRKNQFKKIKTLVEHAYKNSRFYREYYDSHNFHPNELKDYEDLKKIPVVKRQMLKKISSEDVLTRKNKKNLIVRTTSGSSGIPVSIYLTRFEKFKMYWGFLRNYLKAGMGIFDKSIALRDPVDCVPQTLYQKMGILKHEYYNIFRPIDDIYEEIKLKNKKIDILKGMPSDLLSLAIVVNEKGNFPPVRIIYSDSEVLDKSSRQYIEKAFSAKILDFYATIECGMIAYQSQNNTDGYYINTDFVALESLNCQKEDKAVVTNLVNYTYPIIRYEIGDVIDFGERCDFSLPVERIDQIHGKYLDFIILPDKSIVSPHVPKQELTYIKDIKLFKLTQTKIDEVNLIIESKHGLKSEVEKEVLTRMKNAFKNLVKVNLEYVDSFGKVDMKKFKVIESTVAQEFISEKVNTKF